MLSNASKVKLNQLLFNATTWNTLAENDTTTPDTTITLALHQSWPGRTGSQSTGVATYTNYANITPARSNAAFTVNGTTGVVTLAAEQSFPASSSSGNDQYLPYWSAANSAGEIIAMGAILMSGTAFKPFTALAADNTLTCIAHGGASTNRCAVFAVNGQSLPTGLTEGTIYYVRSDVATNTLTLAATSGGAAIDITADGSGILAILDGFQVGNNYTPKLSTSSAIVLD